MAEANLVEIGFCMEVSSMWAQKSTKGISATAGDPDTPIPQKPVSVNPGESRSSEVDGVTQINGEENVPNDWFQYKEILWSLLWCPCQI